mmetsp:Transcript_67892/g.102409  ORF Transcript_67892/g.102409 Transcript_67892/m.102409 type:complete len:138 (-) Transcript_67892:965-1378(-)
MVHTIVAKYNKTEQSYTNGGASMLPFLRLGEASFRLLVDRADFGDLTCDEERPGCFGDFFVLSISGTLADFLAPGRGDRFECVDTLIPSSSTAESLGLGDLEPSALFFRLPFGDLMDASVPSPSDFFERVDLGDLEV